MPGLAARRMAGIVVLKKPRFDKGVSRSYVSGAAAMPEMAAYRSPYRPVTEDFMLGFSSLAKQFFGSANERKIKPLWATVAKINALEPRFQAMSDEELRAMTPAFRERLARAKTLDDILPEAFAVVREAPSAPWASAISTCSWWAAWCCMMAISPR